MLVVEDRWACAHGVAAGRSHRLATLTNHVDLVLTTIRPNLPTHGLTNLLANCRDLLRPGRHVIITARPHRTHDGHLLDLPGCITAAAHAAGLLPVQRCIALAPTNRVEPRRHVRQPACRPAHHNIMILRAPDATSSYAANPSSPRILEAVA